MLSRFDNHAARSGPLDRTVMLKGIAKSYASKIAVDVAELRIADGEFLTLLGPSGCGKTTLLMILAGFVRPDRGSIAAGARDITHLVPEKRNFGMVFQGYALFPHLNVKDNVAYPLRRRGLDRARTAARVSAVLEKVQLAHLAERYPRQLSGGQQQRVALARSIVFDPDMILLDEPLSALDANLRYDLQEQLKELHRETGTTFVCVTHDQDEALSMSDRIAVMREGRIIQLATPQQLYKQPASRFVANFMGAKNFLTLTVERVRDGLAIGTANGVGLVQAVNSAIPTGSRITIAVRPNSIALGDRVGPNKIRGTVTSFSYLGADLVVTLASEVGPLTMRHPATDTDSLLVIGEQVVASWDPAAPVIVADDI